MEPPACDDVRRRHARKKDHLPYFQLSGRSRASGRCAAERRPCRCLFALRLLGTACSARRPSNRVRVPLAAYLMPATNHRAGPSPNMYGECRSPAASAGTEFSRSADLSASATGAAGLSPSDIYVCALSELILYRCRCSRVCSSRGRAVRGHQHTGHGVRDRD